MTQILNVFGATILLVAYIALSANKISATDRRYLLANAVGGAVLAYTAYEAAQWGFVVLESVWGSVAFWSLIRPAKSPAEKGL